MASVNSLPCEEQFLCSICLDAFTEPVSTPCGHNYCKTCITGYWASSDLTQCPLCKEKFHHRPELQVNTEFRDMVEHFKKMRVRSEDEVLAKPGEVSCDVCHGLKLKAQKTCLVCLASYCQPHLEPHQRVPTLKKHKLIDPVSNLEDRVCKRHDKMFELFCPTDQTCVCFMCLKDNHATHKAIPLEHVFRERKAHLENVTSEMKMIEVTKTRSIKEIRYSVEQNRKESEKEIQDINEIFAALVASLQRSRVNLIELIQEKREAAKEKAEDHVAQLKQEVDELRRRRSKIEQVLQTEDDFHLLQNWPSLYFPSHNKDPFHLLSCSTPPFTQDLPDSSQQSYVGMVKKAVAQMEKTLSNEMEVLIHGVRLSDGCESAKQPDAAEKLVTDELIKEVWNPPEDELRMIQQCHAVDVTLDAYTANSKLLVSEDGKQLTIQQGRMQQFFNSLNVFGRRFEYQPYVLGKEAFSSGRFYYEVRVSGSRGWLLGVVKESIKNEFNPNLSEHGWSFSGIHFQREDFAHSSVHSINSGPMRLRQRPQTVGVFGDYEKGEISFYDVDARTLIYSYTGCVFTETTPALKAFLYSLTDSPLSGRLKLYPIFGIFGEEPDNVLVITPVGRAT
ncbi:tripartite motif-containing protein 60-like [Xiphias gladius]|uniref:tripartite motif-containing protein 60-like n=1 Tax=Xiphias gladius TaxID=8245 RepID=UPI001A9A0056|nr:tripartite motif-containing protein 60-like [Xiphias gladius]